MHHRRLICLPLAAVALLAPVASAHAAKTSVKLKSCTTDLAPTARSASFEASISRTKGADRLGVKFTLQIQRPGSKAWEKIASPGLDEWYKSQSGKRRYKYLKTIQNLEAPARYRMRVAFRWYSKSGRTLKTTIRRSASCRQPDLRPDLRISRVERGKSRIRVFLRNAGRSQAGTFAVALSANGKQYPAKTIAALAAGKDRLVVFDVPADACTAGQRYTVTVDTADAVPESVETNNVRNGTC
jgi:hypothetical protein